MKTLIAAFAAVLLAACSEIPQDGPKPFADASETKSHVDAKTLAQRTDTQDEYIRMKE